MIIVDSQLNVRQKRANPIKVGVIGAGVMGMGVINQIIKYSPGIEVPVVYNRSRENALKSFGKIGIKDYALVDSQKALNENIAKGKFSLIEDISLMINAQGLDLLIEMTGSIDFGLTTILDAFKNGKNVLSFNAELEATLGFFLKKEAEKYGVKYGVADGDQPAVTVNLFRFVKQMGLQPLVCGNIKGLQDRTRTPFTQKGFAEQWEMTPEMVTSFADGTKISIEQACIANATNMSIAQRGMLGYHAEGHVDELMHLFDFEMLKEKGGIVDYLVGPKPGPGVFIYATAPDDPILLKYLKYMKLGEGPLYCFYIPYHLLFLEIASSICRIIDFDDTILTADYGLNVEVIAIAKTDLKKGDKIDGMGGFKTYGVCETSQTTRVQSLLPMGLAQGSTLLNDVPKDSAISMKDVILPKNKLAVNLYNEQTKLLEKYGF